MLDIPSCFPDQINDSLTMVWFLWKEWIYSSGFSIAAISCAISFWNWASFFTLDSMVAFISFKLSLRFWIADADISADVFLATENTTTPKTANTNIIERNREIPWSFLPLIRLFFIYDLLLLLLANNERFYLPLYTALPYPLSSEILSRIPSCHCFLICTLLYALLYSLPQFGVNMISTHPSPLVRQGFAVQHQMTYRQGTVYAV